MYALPVIILATVVVITVYPVGPGGFSNVPARRHLSLAIEDDEPEWWTENSPVLVRGNSRKITIPHYTNANAVIVRT